MEAIPPVTRQLTAKQEAFCRYYVAEGCSASAAYRATYDAENMGKASINVAASQLMANPAVAIRLEELFEEAAAAAAVTRAKHLKRLKELSENAEKAGDFGPSVTAEVARGKVVGLYEQKVAHRFPQLGWQSLFSGQPAGETLVGKDAPAE